MRSVDRCDRTRISSELQTCRVCIFLFVSVCLYLFLLCWYLFVCISLALNRSLQEHVRHLNEHWYHCAVGMFTGLTQLTQVLATFSERYDAFVTWLAHMHARIDASSGGLSGRPPSQSQLQDSPVQREEFLAQLQVSLHTFSISILSPSTFSFSISVLSPLLYNFFPSLPHNLRHSPQWRRQDFFGGGGKAPAT